MQIVSLQLCYVPVALHYQYTHTTYGRAITIQNGCVENKTYLFRRRETKYKEQNLSKTQLFFFSLQSVPSIQPRVDAV